MLRSSRVSAASPAFIVLALVAGIASLIALGVFAREEIRKAFFRTILFTTADPDVLGEVASTSMEPITVKLEVKRPELILTPGGQRESGRKWDRSLTITAPAAYFYQISLKDGPAGPQHASISVWSKQFDPAQPNVIEWEQAFRERSRPDQPSTKYAYERRIAETGEYELRFQVINNVRRSAEERQYFLKGNAEGDQRQPCEKGFDSELQMVTFGAPEGQKVGERWCLLGNDFNATNYMKLNDDGSIKFVVNCGGTGPRGTPIDRSDQPHNRAMHGKMCWMISFFGSWPLRALVPYRHRGDWADAFARIQTFLAKVATEKTGPGESS
jgi:hypothetical protein